MTGRTWFAAALLAGALAVLLVAWFFSGWADVRSRQREIRAAPEVAATQRANELAGELHGELASLLTHEVERPYFYYQNLFHDPRAGANWNVAPSPLAASPDDSLVLGYFQLDGDGRVTTPTINDDVPELSDPKHLAANQRFRDEVVRSLSGPLASLHRRAPELVAVAVPPRPRVHHVPVAPPPQAQQPQPEPQGVTIDTRPPPEPEPQVVTIDRSTYLQNASPTDVYWAQNAMPATGRVRSQLGSSAEQPPAVTQQAIPPPPPPPPTVAEQPAPRVAPRPVPPPSSRPAPSPKPSPVTITVSPLEWRTLDFAGVPALVAVRQVQTPDGTLAQGFVVDRTTLTSWLAAHAGDAVAELRQGDGAAEIAPGWHLAVAANPRTLVRAVADAAAAATAFVLRFVAVGVIAILAAMLVVMLVARAERLARERSQFAAAAAHELRTPLAGLQLYGDMLADGLGDPGKVRDYARRMSEEASRLGRVVSNVLGFSQLERGNLSVEPRVDELAGALRELADRAQPALDRAGAALELEVAAELPARFDRDALARIVGNLLDNAEKYGRDAGDRTIALSAKPVGDVVEVSVRDHGPGIAAEVRTRLFRPFARGVTGDGPAGLGLGLALSQSLARAMGGDLEYRSASGGGAAFVLRLARA